MSHGGLRQKVFNAYEETLRVPLVISNPLLFPEPVRTDALASLIDVMPTLATLAQAPARQSWNFLGTDLTPVIVDAAAYSAKSQRAGSGHDSVHLRRSELCDARRSEHRHAAQPHSVHTRESLEVHDVLRSCGSCCAAIPNCTTYKPTPWN